MKWFKHFTKSLSDAKIEKLIMKYGIEGYGLYFACLEIIAGNLTDENITFELEHDAEILAHKFKLDQIKTQEMMLYMVNLGLFELNPQTNLISCLKLAQYIDSSLIKNPQLLKIKQSITQNPRKVEKSREKSSQIRLDKIRLEYNNTVDTASADQPVCGKSKKAEQKLYFGNTLTQIKEYYQLAYEYSFVRFDKPCPAAIYWDAKECKCLTSLLKFVETTLPGIDKIDIETILDMIFRASAQTWIFDLNYKEWKRNPYPSTLLTVKSDLPEKMKERLTYLQNEGML